MPRIDVPAWALALALLFVSTACADSGAPTPDAPPTRPASASAEAEAAPPADPETTAYDRLQQTLTRYQRMAEEGGWPDVGTGDVLEEGDVSPRVLVLRQRLAAEGDLSGSTVQETDSLYDASLIDGVRAFQRRHGLTVDGLLGPNTVAALNTPVETRIDQIERTIRRLGELPDELGTRYVIVNVPEYRVRAFENGQEVLQMEVVVGAAYDGRQTPTFRDSMEYVIFSPYWNVPPSIATEEIVPEAREQGLGYLAENDYEITNAYGPDAEVYAATWANLDRVAAGDLRIRQAPGEQNALGLVKFMFPNEHAIYLHDTPADNLFDKFERDFSHGCIRLERPQDFAEWVLGWDAARVEEAMTNNEWQRVDLDQEIPVYVLYWTAYVDEDGTVFFLPDIYDRV